MEKQDIEDIMSVLEQNGFVVTRKQHSELPLACPTDPNQSRDILLAIVDILNRDYYLDSLTVDEIRQCFKK